MLRAKVVVSGMSVSLKENVSVTKTRKILAGHVQVCLEINTIMIILVKAGFTYYQWSGQMLVNVYHQYADIHGFLTMEK